MKEAFEFLTELKHNNTREWFTANKATFQKHENTVKSCFEQVQKALANQDNIEAMKMFRIYRDVRFAKDKTPYKTNFSCTFVRQKPYLRGGYYLQIEPDNSFVGGGFWEPSKEDLFRIRKEIELDHEELEAIINTTEFKETFGILQGEELKTAPKGFDKEHPAIELLRKKQFLLMKKYSNQEVLAPMFVQQVAADFKAMLPFFDYMSVVLKTDLNGEDLY